MTSNSPQKLLLRSVAIFAVSGTLMACSSDNSVKRFLDNTSNKINSIDTRIVGSGTGSSACRPNPYAPAVSDPAPLFAGRTFTYQRGARHRGKITYEQGGTFSWENEDGTKVGTGNWTTQGAKWCESFNASVHNEALSSRCWPVVNANGALCYGVTRLVPDPATNPPD